MDKVHKIMSEYKSGKLHSGSKKGPMVKSHKQAVAIALNEAGKSQKGTSRKTVMDRMKEKAKYA